MQVVVCLMADLQNVHMTVHSPSGRYGECSCSSVFVQWWISGIFTQWSVCPPVDFGNVQMAVCLPNGRFQSASYSLSLMSCIVGPGAFGFSEVASPLMTILPMEVVTVSTHVRPVALSLTIQLELMLEIPGAITSPTGRVSPGTS